MQGEDVSEGPNPECGVATEPCELFKSQFPYLEMGVIISASSHRFEVRTDQSDARLWRGLPAPRTPSPDCRPHLPCFLRSVLILGRARCPGLTPLSPADPGGGVLLAFSVCVGNDVTYTLVIFL